MEVLLAAVAVLATLSGAESLPRQIEDKDAAIRRLRQRIEVLERRIASDAPVREGSDEPEPVRALERALVRESGLLLPRGVLEIEPNFVYSHFKDRSADFRRDAFGPGLALRIGLPRRSQLDLELPYVFEHRRDAGTTNRSSGWGDAVLGLSHQLLTDEGRVPGLIATVRYQASTGENTVFESATPVAHGSGFDAIQAALAAVKRKDPLVFFGSYTYTRNASAVRGSVEVDPGSSHAVRFGTLLAASPDASLRALFELTFFDETRLDGMEVAGSDDPVAKLELGTSVLLDRAMALDVSVEGGLTSNAPDYRISVALPLRF